MTEAELCLLVEQYFAGAEIYKEVPSAGGRCDIYMKQGPFWTAVEVKKQFSSTLIYQAMRNMPRAHYSWVAVPELKGSASAIAICRALGIGVMEYSVRRGVPQWSIIHQAAYRRTIKPLRVLDVMKQHIAGVQHTDISPFKITVELIAQYIARQGGSVPVKGFFDKNRYHYSSPQSARQCIVNLCKVGAIKQFHIQDGNFVLSTP